MIMMAAPPQDLLIWQYGCWGLSRVSVWPNNDTKLPSYKVFFAADPSDGFVVDKDDAFFRYHLILAQVFFYLYELRSS